MKHREKDKGRKTSKEIVKGEFSTSKINVKKFTSIDKQIFRGLKRTNL